jgi:hypothetical protein
MRSGCRFSFFSACSQCSRPRALWLRQIIPFVRSSCSYCFQKVPLFYESRVGKAVINYGCSVGHIPARIASTDHAGDVAVSACASTPHLLGQCYCTASDTHNHKLTPDQFEALMSKLSQGLDEGGLGIGMGIAYVQECDHEEVYRVFQKCAEHDTVRTHTVCLPQCCFWLHLTCVRSARQRVPHARTDGRTHTHKHTHTHTRTHTHAHAHRCCTSTTVASATI